MHPWTLSPPSWLTVRLSRTQLDSSVMVMGSTVACWPGPPVVLWLCDEGYL